MSAKPKKDGRGRPRKKKSETLEPFSGRRLPAEGRAWKAAAKRAGLGFNDWLREQLNRAAG